MKLQIADVPDVVSHGFYSCEKIANCRCPEHLESQIVVSETLGIANCRFPGHRQFQYLVSQTPVKCELPVSGTPVKWGMPVSRIPGYCNTFIVEEIVGVQDTGEMQNAGAQDTGSLFFHCSLVFFKLQAIATAFTATIYKK